MKPGSSLEKDVQRVYTSLLNMRDEGIVVGTNIVMKGKSGAPNEIDVYYEFERAGIKHRVAIECKDWATPVAKRDINGFDSKLKDIGNITGVVISRNGYQSGAIDFAKFNDIILMRFEDLPSFGNLLAERLKTVALPDESYIGEPFWTIMEVRNGKTTGSHFSTDLFNTGLKIIPLTYSKQLADRMFIELSLDPSKWAVRGLPKFAFRAFLIHLDLYEKKNIAVASICFSPPRAEPKSRWIGIQVSREDLINDYYGEPIPSIDL